MELFILITINVVTAGIIYFFFSMRFTVAVEKARKNSLMEELKENIEATIEFINTSLDLMDQKNRTFYQLVRKSEELAERLEAAAEPQRKKGGASASKSRKKDPVVAPEESDGRRSDSRENRNGGETARAGRRAKTGERAEEGDLPHNEEDLAPRRARDPFFADEQGLDDRHIMRLLQGSGEDRLDLTAVDGDVEGIYRSGEASSPGRSMPSSRTSSLASGFDKSATGGSIPTQGANRKAPGTGGEQVVSLMRTLGGGVRKMFGMKSASTGPSTTAEDGAGKGGDGSAAFQSILESEGRRAARSQDQLSRNGGTPGIPVNEGGLRDGGRKDRFERTGEKPQEGMWDGYFSSISPLESLLGAIPSLDETAREPAEIQLPSRPSPSKLERGADQEDRGPSPGLFDLIEEARNSGVSRSDLIRSLLDAGYNNGEIVAATGYSRPEVDLVASLPRKIARPRRQRRTEDS